MLLNNPERYPLIEGKPLANARLQLDAMDSVPLCRRDDKKALDDLVRILSDLLERKLPRSRWGIVPGKLIKVSSILLVVAKATVASQQAVRKSLSSLTSYRLTGKGCRITWNQSSSTVWTYKEDNTAHHAHQSVKQHLFEPQCSPSAEFMELDLDKQSWYLCMTHLDLKRENEIRGLLFR